MGGDKRIKCLSSYLVSYGGSKPPEYPKSLREHLEGALCYPMRVPLKGTYKGSFKGSFKGFRLKL